MLMQMSGTHCVSNLTLLFSIMVVLPRCIMVTSLMPDSIPASIPKQFLTYSLSIHAIARQAVTASCQNRTGQKQPTQQSLTLYTGSSIVVVIFLLNVPL